MAREEDAPFQDKLKISSTVGIWNYDKLGRKQTLGFRQLLFQFCIIFLSSMDLLRLAQGDAALQNDVLMEFIMQRLLFL